MSSFRILSLIAMNLPHQYAPDCATWTARGSVPASDLRREQASLENPVKIEAWTGSELSSETAVVGDEVGSRSMDFPLVRLRVELELAKDGRLLFRFKFDLENVEEIVDNTP